MYWLKRMMVMTVVLLLLVPLLSGRREEGYGGRITPAQAVAAEDLALVKYALCGEEICFSADDFEEVLGREGIDGVVVDTLPPFSAGCLYVGGLAVFEGQYLSARDLSFLRFVPTEDGEGMASFSVTVGKTSYQVECTLYHRSEVNYAPTVAGLAEEEFSVATYRNITYFGRMPIRDPEGDGVRYEVVSYPKKGVLTLQDSKTGSYLYTPVKNFAGTDRFRYVVYDEYGNASEEITVAIEVIRSEEGMIFSDLIGDAAHNSAIALHDAGLMSSYEDGGEGYFAPEIELTRAEWIALCMKAVGIVVPEQTVVTVFSDDSAIPSEYKGYIAAAYECGYIDGFEMSGLPTLLPDATIDVAEASLLLGKILNGATPEGENGVDPEGAQTIADQIVEELGDYLTVSSAEKETVVDRRTAALLLHELLTRMT